MDEIILKSSYKKGVVTLTLNNPDSQNALEYNLIKSLSAHLHAAQEDPEIRIVILAAQGKVFCSGEDFKAFPGAQEEAVLNAFSDLLYQLYTFPKPTIAMVQGPVYGNGIGLVACADIVIASDSAVFCLSEAKLGLVPGIIAPYMIATVGGRATKRYFLTAERFGAAEALRSGLVHEVVAPAELEPVVEHIVRSLLDGGPKTQRIVKELLHNLQKKEITKEAYEEAQAVTAKCRSSEEAKEGIKAFLEKRLPAWRDRDL